jgi:hypothetical protein
VILLLACLYLLEYVLRIRSQPGIALPHTVRDIVWRALFSGAVITFAVFVGSIGGAVFGAVFSSFPAVFLSTLVIAHHRLGYAFAQSLTKPLMVSGLLNCVVYALAAGYLYPVTGVWIGTLLAVLITVFSLAVTFMFVQRRLT